MDDSDDLPPKENNLYDDSIISASRKCEECLEVFEVQNIVYDDHHDCSKKNEGEPHKIEIKVRKRDGLRTLPASGYSSLLPYQTPQVREILNNIFLVVSPKLIVDATCHIGGDTLHFAKIFPQARILAIDNDIDAVNCLKANIEKEYPKGIMRSNSKGFSSPIESRIEVVCADSTVYIPSNKIKADLYYFDPPWGGPDYSNKGDIDLFLSDINMIDLINDILKLELSTKIILKAPRNFAYANFCSKVDGCVRHFYIKKPQKGGSIAYTLILITAKN